MKRTLLLNSDWTPLCFISGMRAFNLVYLDRAEVISLGEKPSVWDDEFFTTVSDKYDIPATIRLLNYVSKKWQRTKFRKKVLCNRDSWVCQYCFTPLTHESVTIDHVLPTSRGGKTTWNNCVIACKSCNRKKANRTPSEAGMLLRNPPASPKPTDFWAVRERSQKHEDWVHFLSSN